jgi:hypothetical protein
MATRVGYDEGHLESRSSIIPIIDHNIDVDHSRTCSAYVSSTCDILVSIDQLGSMWTKRIVWRYVNAISCAIIYEAIARVCLVSAALTHNPCPCQSLRLASPFFQLRDHSVFRECGNYVDAQC